MPTFSQKEKLKGQRRQQSSIELHFLEDGIKRLEKKSWKIAKLRNEKGDDFERNLEIGTELINQI